jgi:hypothetical protein
MAESAVGRGFACELFPTAIHAIMMLEAINMSMAGGGANDNAFLIGPFMDWWARRVARRDAKRTAKQEALAAFKVTEQDQPQA